MTPSWPRISVYSINYDSLKVRLYAVTPRDWEAYVNHMRNANNYGSDEAAQKQRTPPGRLAHSKTIPVTAKPDEMIETRIDLSPALQKGLGQVIVVVEADVRSALPERPPVGRSMGAGDEYRS